MEHKNGDAPRIEYAPLPSADELDAILAAVGLSREATLGAYLLGSHLWGTATRSSDRDILVVRRSKAAGRGGDRGGARGGGKGSAGGAGGVRAGQQQQPPKALLSLRGPASASSTNTKLDATVVSEEVRREMERVIE